MPKLRFIHVSDIHFGQERDGTLVIHDDIRDELVRHCREQCGVLGQADGILVTGDVAYSGKKEAYHKASEWLETLSKAAGCARTAVMVIPGNHDIDLDLIDHTGGLVQNQLRIAPAAELDMHLEGISKGNEASNPLLPKLATYREFAAQYGCDFESASKPAWEKKFVIADSHIVKFVGLNSVQVSDKKDKLGTMVLGNTQYVLPRLENVEYIILLHHPLSWFLDREKAKTYFKRARVIMFGHEHNLGIDKVIDETGEEQLTLYSGATNPPEDDNAYHYRYNWLEFDLKTVGSSINLAVTIYPKIWDSSQTKFINDQARLGGAISKEILIRCPNLRLSPAPQPGTVNSSPPESSITGSIEATQRQTNMTKKSESDEFARLRYFFWRYLSWADRIKVLAELDILPASLSQPVPQTMERLALDNAIGKGKQYELWAAVMRFVPADKRESNPFIKEEG